MSDDDDDNVVATGSGLPRLMKKLDPPTLCQKPLPPDSGGSDF